MSLRGVHTHFRGSRGVLLDRLAGTRRGAVTQRRGRLDLDVRRGEVSASSANPARARRRSDDDRGAGRPTARNDRVRRRGHVAHAARRAAAAAAAGADDLPGSPFQPQPSAPCRVLAARAIQRSTASQRRSATRVELSSLEMVELGVRRRRALPARAIGRSGAARWDRTGAGAPSRIHRGRRDHRGPRRVRRRRASQPDAEAAGGARHSST